VVLVGSFVVKKMMDGDAENSIGSSDEEELVVCSKDVFYVDDGYTFTGMYALRLP
jgi:hypothetical protein